MTLVRTRFRAAPSLSGSHAWLHGVNSVLMRHMARDLFFHGVHLTLTDPQLDRAATLRTVVVEALAGSADRYLPAGETHRKVVMVTREPQVAEVDGDPTAMAEEASRIAAQQGPPDTVILGPPRAHQADPSGHPDVRGWLGSITGVVETYADSVGHTIGTRLVLPVPHNPPTSCRPLLYGFVRDLSELVGRTQLRLHVAWYPGDLSGDARDAAETSQQILRALVRSRGWQLAASRRTALPVVGQTLGEPLRDTTSPFRRLLHRGDTLAPATRDADLPLVEGVEAPAVTPGQAKQGFSTRL